MRIGDNPQRHQKINIGTFDHQVIMPVYIPNIKDYYQESFEVMKLSLNSLLKTSSTNTFISVVANGCCMEVVEYLTILKDENKINELIITDKIGKINSILKAVVGFNFKLITITDADVLFLNNWQKATYEVFLADFKVGYVCLSPSPRVLKYNTENLIIDKLFNKNLRFEKPVDQDALLQFGKSLGTDNFYNTHHLNNILIYKTKKNIKYVIGGGHFVGTYRSEIFTTFKVNYSNYLLGGASELNFLDKPVVENGYYRVSTYENYVYHMGNSCDKLYVNTYNNIQNSSDIVVPDLKSQTSKNYKLKCLLFKILFTNKKFWKLFLKYKGLSDEAAKYY